MNSWRALLIPALVVPCVLFARVEDEGDEAHEQYFFIKNTTYTPAKGKNGSQRLELTFDLSPDVPKGTKLELELEHQGLALDSTRTFYTLKDSKRDGLKLVWKFKERLAVDEYRLWTRIRLESQKAAVRTALLAKTDKWREADAPFSWYFFNDPIQLGTPEELAEEREKICEAYGELLEELVGNLKEFSATLREVAAGEKYVDGETLNVEEFTAFVVEWRTKQGETQKKIAAFPQEQAQVLQKSRTAYANLVRLGRMISKRSLAKQKDVTQQYGAGIINPKSHPSFDRTYKFTVSSKSLKDSIEKIYDLACPEEAEEGDASEEEGSDE